MSDYVFDPAVLEAKRLELEEELTAWVNETGVLPEGHRLVASLNLTVVAPLPRVEVTVNLPDVGERFKRGPAVYLQRRLTSGEIDSLRKIPWRGTSRLIAGLVLDRGNVGTSADDINKELALSGFQEAEADVHHCYGRINAVLSCYNVNIRFTFTVDGDGKNGPYRFFQRFIL